MSGGEPIMGGSEEGLDLRLARMQADHERRKWDVVLHLLGMLEAGRRSQTSPAGATVGDARAAENGGDADVDPPPGPSANRIWPSGERRFAPADRRGADRCGRHAGRLGGRLCGAVPRQTAAPTCQWRQRNATRSPAAPVWSAVRSLESTRRT
jgi:hypothetical protein